MTLANQLASMLSAISRRAPPIAMELRESELRFRQLTENIREVFFLVHPQFARVFYISPAYEEIWGRSCESLYAHPRSFIDAIHGDDRERTIQAIAPQGTVIPCDVEYRVVRPDGTLRWVRARAFPIRNETGDIYRFAGIAEDITERKGAVDQVTRQAEALAQSNRRLSLLGEMTGLLQTVVSVEEAAAIVGGYMAQVHVVVPGVTREEMAIWAERLLGRVPGMKVVAERLVLPKLTVSIGIAFFPEDGEEMSEVIFAADQALYAAKKAGRDRYMFSTERSGSAGGAGAGAVSSAR